MKYLTPKKGFSLIEASIVILVIGILIVAISYGKSIIRESRLISAQSLTKTSPINATDNLVGWLDSSSKDTILNTNGAPIQNGEAVKDWKDINPQSANANKVNLSQPTPSNRPIYISSGINNLPSLHFDQSVGQYLLSNNGPLDIGDKSFTLVGVFRTEPLPDNGIQEAIVSQSGATYNFPADNGTIAALTCESDWYCPGFYGFNSWYAPLLNYTENKNFIAIIVVNDQSAKIYSNSTTPISGNMYNYMSPYLGPSGKYFTVGSIFSSLSNFYFNGYISEIAVFNRPLKQSESAYIVEYLSKKYNITLTATSL